MFETVQKLPPDPILGLNQVFQEDNNPEKINLSVGVYQNDAGLTPIFSAVKKAEQELLRLQETKSYAPQAGDPTFNDQISRLILTDKIVENLGSKLSTVMTPGGCGALRMLAELLVRARAQTTLWVSTPTWGNHFPLLESAGLSLKEYAYYDANLRGIDFEATQESLNLIPKGDVVLLHGCCHNPTGADFTHEQWDKVIDILAEREITAFFDVAYQGFGDGLDEDAYAIRQAVQRLPEVIIASSCSKNFGLYRERTGAAIIVSQSQQATAAATSQLLAAARTSYSMSPYHGGGIVAHLLSNKDLRDEWINELEQMRVNMNGLRERLASSLNQAQDTIDFGFLARSKGMFCFLGIAREDVLTLRSEFGIYLLESTRINVAGLSDKNLPVIVQRVSDVITRN